MTGPEVSGMVMEGLTPEGVSYRMGRRGTQEPGTRLRRARGKRWVEFKVMSFQL